MFFFHIRILIAPLVSSNSSYNLFITIVKTGTYRKNKPFIRICKTGTYENNKLVIRIFKAGIYEINKPGARVTCTGRLGKI
jgi:hypothetical protein